MRLLLHTFLFVAGAAFCLQASAATPPSRNAVPPAAGATHAHPRHPPSTARGDGKPIQRESLESLNLSPSLFRLLAAPVQACDATANIGSSTVGSADTVMSLNATSMHTDATQDTFEDREPVVMVTRINSIDRATTVYMKVDEPEHWLQPRLYFSTTTNFSTFYRSILTHWPDFPLSGDPAIAQNPYTSGVGPKQLYVVGSNWSAGDLDKGNNQLSLWVSSDGGVNWSMPKRIAWAANADDWFYDKPAIAVSWANVTLGQIFVAVMRVSTIAGRPSELLLYQKTTDPSLCVDRCNDAGFELIDVIATGNEIHAPQVVVDSRNGDVYVCWLDYDYETVNIRRAYRSYNGTQFEWVLGGVSSTSAGRLLARGRDVLRDALGQNGFQARSMISARFNTVANEIAVVWHARQDLASDDSDVFIATFSPAYQTWQSTHTVSQSSSGDQWNPAIDWDDSGNYLVTFYDRSRDSNDLLYDVTAASLSPAGQRIGSADITVNVGGRGDPRSYSARGLGEYQDAWYWFGTWYTSDVFIPATEDYGDGYGDIFIGLIQP